jgi:type II secretory pathway component GspD/PulD (secretin)
MVFVLSGCALFDPIQNNQAGRVVAQAQETRDAEVEALPEYNRAVRRNSDEVAMNTPARTGSGLIGEVDVEKSMKKSQAGAGKDKASAVKLEFEDTSLKDVITVFMQDYLKKPYTFQDSFKDRKVNLFFDAKATHEDLVTLFDALLDNYGVRLRYSGGVYLVGSSEDKASPLQQPSPLGIGDAIGVFRLKFVDARDFQGLAKQVVKYPDKITVLPGNVLVVNSSSTDLRGVRSLLDDVDVPAFSGKFILTYAPRYLSAGSLIVMLDGTQSQLLGAQGTNKQFEAKQITDVERIVIVAANKAARDLVVQLLAQTDVAGANQRRVFQYTLGTQNAPDIVANLDILIKSALKGPAEVKVVADKGSNSLFIYASPEEYVEIRKLLSRLDHRPPGVQVEIIIAEVRLNDAMQYGVEWYLKSAGSLTADISGSLGVPASVTPNLALGLVDSLSNYATLQLIASKTSFSLLSNPKIVVKNGATAKISIGQEQPVIKTKSTVNVTGGATTVEPEFKKIGLELEVTPTVTTNNEVRIIIKLKDTSITGNVTLGTDIYPILANREINTDFVTADGRTVFLGGLRKQDATDTASMIPGLADVQGIGALFRNKKMDTNGSELIILATPTIMLDQQGADTLTRALLRASRQEFKGIRPPVPKPEKQQSAQPLAEAAHP